MVLMRSSLSAHCGGLQHYRNSDHHHHHPQAPRVHAMPAGCRSRASLYAHLCNRSGRAWLWRWHRSLVMLQQHTFHCQRLSICRALLPPSCQVLRRHDNMPLSPPQRGLDKLGVPPSTRPSTWPTAGTRNWLLGDQELMHSAPSCVSLCTRKPSQPIALPALLHPWHTRSHGRQCALLNADPLLLCLAKPVVSAPEMSPSRIRTTFQASLDFHLGRLFAWQRRCCLAESQSLNYAAVPMTIFYHAAAVFRLEESCFVANLPAGSRKSQVPCRAKRILRCTLLPRSGPLAQCRGGLCHLSEVVSTKPGIH